MRSPIDVAYERDLIGTGTGPVSIGVAGPDLAGDAAGRLLVLEDNVRTPTMLAYAVAGRALVRRHVGGEAPGPDAAVALRHGLSRLLRPYVLASPDGYEVLPVAFSRFSPAAGDMVVNCSRGGGGKDVWIVPEGDRPRPEVTSTRTSLTPPPRRAPTTTKPAASIG